ncbi:ABC transporter [Nitrospira sp.]|nr:ABC transporter [Nitrospira sp.]
MTHGLLSLLNGRPRLRSRSSQVPSSEALWALKDVSFTIHRGEVVGIIGRNGSGKSTLLKLLSRVTEPTTGRATVHGRVGSLLEVGTGFHPELSGRDNVYLSGSILGMSREEIDRKFRQIAEFSGVQDFLDTPVKRFSSGMYVRLAFAVGAYLEPDILLVDEALAVGDLEFQRKCMEKMRRIGDQGQTVILVSHNMEATARLCHRVIHLDRGRIVADGPAQKVVAEYLHGGSGSWSQRVWAEDEAPGDETVQLGAVRIMSAQEGLADTIDVRDCLTVEMEYNVLKSDHPIVPSVTIRNEHGLDVFETFDLDPEWRGVTRPPGRYVGRVRIPGNLLTEGTYYVSPGCFRLRPFQIHFFEPQAAAFHVVDRVEGDSARGDFTGHMRGIVRPLLKWSNEYDPSQGRSRPCIVEVSD